MNSDGPLEAAGRGDERRMAAVLLAAGEGSRMGGLPKCLLQLGGKPLIERHCEALVGAGVGKIVVVTGYHHERIEPAVAGLPLTVARNARPERGQASSVRVGLEALGEGCELVIVALADQPLVGRAELDELIRAFRHRPPGTQIVYPSVAGQRGNPVLFAGGLVADLLAAGRVPGRQYIDEHPQHVHVHETSNSNFVLDLDTREDIAAFERRTGSPILMPAPDGA